MRQFVQRDREQDPEDPAREHGRATIVVILSDPPTAHGESFWHVSPKFQSTRRGNKKTALSGLGTCINGRVIARFQTCSRDAELPDMLC